MDKLKLVSPERDKVNREKDKLKLVPREVCELAGEVATFYNDPLGFVERCYSWGQGELFGATGPDANQREFLESLGNEVRQRNFGGRNPVMPVRMAAVIDELGPPAGMGRARVSWAPRSSTGS
jgi:hypothetical protein